MVTSRAVPSAPRLLPSFFVAHRIQQSRCSSIFHRLLLAHALALSECQFVRKKKSPRIYMSSLCTQGFELTKLTYTRLENNLIRHRGDRLIGKLCTRYGTNIKQPATVPTLVPFCYIMLIPSIYCLCSSYFSFSANRRYSDPGSLVYDV